ncbi:hypothetical protein K227x_28230 [Rubripirellula lacrimiformis]|uniref:Uncharacterized protein n=1 Tax=Rubripirellula lacrimiformis TaxID=1930273 RepID=A0A517NBC2_9BACT|nr:hypothetical protein K227x_28230 [Rubripirellula lacrimiformis]
MDDQVDGGFRMSDLRIWISERDGVRQVPNATVLGQGTDWDFIAEQLAGLAHHFQVKVARQPFEI